MKKNRPFKVDLGFGNLYGYNEPKIRVREQPVRIPAYAKQQYAVYTTRNGVTVKHTFKNPTKAKAFLENARASGSYEQTTDVVLDF